MRSSIAVCSLIGVVILAGIVVCVWRLTAEAPTALPPANWDQLRVGMSEEQVGRLLGKASNEGPNLRVDIDKPARIGTLYDTLLDRLVLLFTFGFEGACVCGWVDGGWWEYYDRSAVTPRPLFALGSSDEAFVVYFYKKKVVWFRHPNKGPFALETPTFVLFNADRVVGEDIVVAQRYLPAFTFHKIIVVSPLPDAIFLPSGVKATEYTLPVWPFKVAVCVRVFTFQSLIVLSSPPTEANVLPSGLNARESTDSSCPLNVAVSMPDFTSHNLTVSSWLPEASVFPSGQKATV
jgi:hypothetical protein